MVEVSAYFDLRLFAIDHTAKRKVLIGHIHAPVGLGPGVLNYFH